MNYRIINADVRAALRELPEQSVHTCVTSPPYWGLRSYGTDAQVWGGDSVCAHEWGDSVIGRSMTGGTNGIAPEYNENRKFVASSQYCHLCGAWRGELGSEPDANLYVEHIVEVFREVKRVLRDDGQLFLNISDTRSKSREWLGIPHRVVFALQDSGWRFEDEIVWWKRNPMPSSQENRTTRAHEFMFVLNKSRASFWDNEAVREKSVKGAAGSRFDKGKTASRDGGDRTQQGERDNDSGRNLRSVWSIATFPTRYCHYATFPPALVIPCIKAGTSEKGVCPACGAPWARIVEKGERVASCERGNYDWKSAAPNDGFVKDGAYQGKPGMAYENATTGWKATCACDAGDPVPATCLDCFSGTATTGAVALELGRSYIGVELNPADAEHSRKRLAGVMPLFSS